MTCLYFKGYALCDGCSHGVHIKHVGVSCQCDICTTKEDQ